jgi:hypothetical protein
MSAEPKQQEIGREVARAGSRRDAGQSPGASAPAQAIASAPASGAVAGTARPAESSYRHDHPIIGHRLANGYMAVHAPGQPCRYCEAAAAARSLPRPPARRRGAIMRAVRSLVAASA